MSTADIERDLISRFERCAPRDRIIIEKTAVLAGRLERLDNEIRSDGCDAEMTELHRQMLTALGESLSRLGPDKIISTKAAFILARCYQTAAAAFGALPAVGCA